MRCMLFPRAFRKWVTQWNSLFFLLHFQWKILWFIICKSHLLVCNLCAIQFSVTPSKWSIFINGTKIDFTILELAVPSICCTTSVSCLRLLVLWSLVIWDFPFVHRSFKTTVIKLSYPTAGYGWEHSEIRSTRRLIILGSSFLLFLFLCTFLWADKKVASLLGKKKWRKNQLTTSRQQNDEENGRIVVRHFPMCCSYSNIQQSAAPGIFVGISLISCCCCSIINGEEPFSSKSTRWTHSGAGWVEWEHGRSWQPVLNKGRPCRPDEPRMAMATLHLRLHLSDVDDFTSRMAGHLYYPELSLKNVGVWFYHVLYWWCPQASATSEVA